MISLVQNTGDNSSFVAPKMASHESSQEALPSEEAWDDDAIMQV